MTSSETTSTGDGSLRWYVVAACLLAIPPILALAGIRFPAGPADIWVEPTDDPFVPGEHRIDVPGVAVLRGDNLLRHDIFVALHDAVDEIRESIAGCELIWVGDVPDRTGLLRKPRPVVPERNASAEQFDRAFETLKTHPLATGQLLSSDGTTMMILLDMADDRIEQDIATAHQILMTHLEPYSVKIRITGNEVLITEHLTALKEWRPFVMGSAALVVSLGSFLLLGSFRRASVVGAGPGFAVLLALGWQSFLGLPQNDLAASLAPVFVLVLAFADSLHIFLAVEDEYSGSGDSRPAVHRAMKRMLRPCFLTSLTTSLAFASLMISDQSMVFGFGRNSAVAIVVGFFGVVTVMPLASADCVRRQRKVTRRTISRRDAWIRRSVFWGVSHPRMVTFATIGITVACTIYATRLRPDDRIDLRLSRSAPSYQGLQMADERLGGLRQITVLVRWPDGASDETLWNVMSSVQQQIKDSSTFSEPLSILNSLQLLPGDDGPRKMRFARRLARDRMAGYWNIDTRRARIDFRVPDRGSRYFDSDLVRLEQLHQQLEADHPGFQFQVSGAALEDCRMVRKTIREMTWSVLLAGGVILAVIWMAYGRLSYALLCILPNAFALAFTMACRASIDQSLDISSAVAASICLGLAVDDTIHFLEALRHARGPEFSRIRTLRAGHLVGRALVVTSGSLLMGFVAVYLIPLPTHQYFAVMVCAMLPAALAGDLVVLPAVLTLAGHYGRGAKVDRDEHQTAD